MTQVTSNNLWQKLTAPHPSITDIEQRRQSKLLSGLMLAMGTTSMLAVLLLINSDRVAGNAQTDHSGVIGSVIFLVFLYFLNRSGRYRLAANLFVAQLFLAMHLFPLITHDLSWLFFAAIPIIISAILLSWRGVLFVFFGSIAAQIALGIIAPISLTMTNIGALIVFFVTAPLILVFFQHRTGLEAERQAELQATNVKLRESELSLEKRVAERTSDLEASRQESELLRLVSQEMNAAQSYTAIVEAIARHVDDPSQNIILGLFENFDRQAATYFDIAAIRPSASEMVIAPTMRFDVGPFETQVGKDLFIVENIGNAPNLSTPMAAYYRANHVGAMMVAGLVLGERVVGLLTMTVTSARQFSPREQRFLRAVADMTAAAVERTRLFNEQVQVAAQLRELDNMKSSFLASMSHELRTPLNAVLNFTKFVSSGMLGPVNDKQVDALNKTIDSGRHLLSLINDVLDITKIESKMLNLFIEPEIDVREELDNVTATAESLLTGKPVTVIRDVSPDLPTVVGDKRRIRQILLNLVSNACKFTDEGSVTISAHMQGDMLEMFVKDSGPGIAPEDHDLIFESFRQTRAGLSQGGGTGLGLAIARRLAEAHGGRLWLESVPGAGATFYVTLPIHSDQLLETMKATISAA